MVNLAEAAVGSVVVVRSVTPGPARRRLEDVGFVRGTRVEIERRAPLGDPTVYVLRGTRIALRRAAAVHVDVEPAQPADGAGP